MLFYFIIHANYLLYFLMAKNIRPYLDHYPDIDTSCYIDEMSVVIGDVKLAENVSVWPFAVIRGDVNSIQIGRNSNVQDHCMLHVSHKNQSKPNGSPLVIGDDVTVAADRLQGWLSWARLNGVLSLTAGKVGE